MEELISTAAIIRVYTVLRGITMVLSTDPNKNRIFGGKI